MDLGLKDCKAFIAGASRGLGKACAKALGDEGARVFICSRNAEELTRAATDVGAADRTAFRHRRSLLVDGRSRRKDAFIYRTRFPDETVSLKFGLWNKSDNFTHAPLQ